MSLQTIIDNTTYLTINKRKGAGVTVSRSGHIKTSVQQGSLYRFTVGAPVGLTYSSNRDVLEDLDSQDITVEANVSLSAFNSNLRYLTEIKGGITDPQTGGNITLNGFTGNVLHIDFSGSANDGSTVFKKGDFIQPEGNTKTYRYPYQVTSDVSATTSANANVSVHRPILAQDGVALTSGGFRLGYNVFFHVVVANMPTYSVVPHDIIEFSEDFELIERIT